MKGLPHIDEPRLRDMRAQGMSATEIAKVFGATPRQIKDLCSIIGIPFGGAGAQGGWTSSARHSADRLAAGLLEHHPEKCGGAR